MTLRSDSQFNTTLYSRDDRFRGIKDDRQVLLIGAPDLKRLGFAPGDRVDAVTEFADGNERRVPDLRLVEYNIPEGCIAGYFPELNRLVPLEHCAEESQVPASKSIPVRLRRAADT